MFSSILSFKDSLIENSSVSIHRRLGTPSFVDFLVVFFLCWMLWQFLKIVKKMSDASTK